MKEKARHEGRYKLKLSKVCNNNMFYKARYKANLTADQASEIVGYSKDHIVRYERDEVKIFNHNIILDLESAYSAYYLAYQHCTETCPIGKEKFLSINDKDLKNNEKIICSYVKEILKANERNINILDIETFEKKELRDIIEKNKKLIKATMLLNSLIQEKLQEEE